MSEARVTLNIKTDVAKRLMRERIDQATRDTFNLDILPEAIQNSPVTPEGMAYNQAKFDSEKHKQGTEIDPVRLKGTGHNRQSLDVEFHEPPSGTEAKLFGQSGYSGYLEQGTSKMRAQPYIWPAFLKFYRNIVDRVKVK
jgi:HK97 gp10 family phage protein